MNEFIIWDKEEKSFPLDENDKDYTLHYHLNRYGKVVVCGGNAYAETCGLVPQENKLGLIK